MNVLSLRENMEKINKPANKTEWEMTPPMVNAYYTPTKNQIGKVLRERLLIPSTPTGPLIILMIVGPLI